MAVIKVNNEVDLKKVFEIRKIVFVDEQEVPIELEMDEFDKDAIHFLCYTDDLEEAIGASRLRFINDYGKLERICVLKPHRRQAYGKQLIQRMEEEIVEVGFHLAKLNAQVYAIGFYEQLGYNVVSDSFYDAGIEHVTMEKKL